MSAGAEAFIRANTTLTAPPHVPEIRLHLASEAHDLWLKTEEELHAHGLPPPFWAFAWAGGQGLARYLLDHHDVVDGRTVLDFATGSGLVAIAAARAGARSVAACDIDPYAIAAAGLNAGENGATVAFVLADLVGTDAGWDVVLAGDIFYDRDLSASVIPWLDALSRRGADVLVGDPGRSYVPHDRLTALATYSVAVLADLEDQAVKRTSVYRYHGDSA